MGLYLRRAHTDYSNSATSPLNTVPLKNQSIDSSMQLHRKEMTNNDDEQCNAFAEGQSVRP